jgi:hypothetical protein
MSVYCTREMVSHFGNYKTAKRITTPANVRSAFAPSNGGELFEISSAFGR